MEFTQTSDPTSLDLVPYVPMAPILPHRKPRKRKARVNYGSHNRKPSLVKQARILAVMHVRKAATMREIADDLGMSVQLVHYHIRKLEYRRVLISTREPNCRGSLRFRVWLPTALVSAAQQWAADHAQAA